MKTRQIALFGALAAVSALMIFDNQESDREIVEPAARPAAGGEASIARLAVATDTQRGSERARRAASPSSILALRSREELIPLDGRQDDSTLFNSYSWTPPPPPPKKGEKPPPPVAPPLPFTYLGKKKEDDVWEVYLGRGDRTVIARQGSVIEGMYSVREIAPTTLSLVYLPLNQIQQLRLGEAH